MKKLAIIFFIMPMLLIPAQRAQAQLIPAKKDIPTNDPGMKYGFHATAEAEHKIFPYLVANIGTEVRMQGDFLYDRQWRFHGGAEYKLAKRFWLTGEYTLIRKHRDGDKVSIRHRVSIGLKETYKFNKKAKITFSERLQWTHRIGDMNEFQSARDQFAIKLKAKFSYDISKKVGLFASGEVRVSLREPNLGDIYYDASQWQYTDAGGSPVGEPGWFLDGFNKLAVNRLRGNIGAEYNFNKQHKLQLSALLDFDRELLIDSDKKGTVIKSLVNDRRLTLYGRITYSFSF